MPDRKGFFKDLLREVAGFAQELSTTATPAEQPVPEPEPWHASRPVPAGPVTWTIDDDALAALVRDVGLGARADDVRGLARASIRLTAAAGEPGRSRLGGVPDLPADLEWPLREGRPLAFLGQVDLAEVATVDAETPLALDGLLLVFYDLAGLPDGLAPADAGSCRVVHVPAGAAPAAEELHRVALRPLPVELSRELTLPSAWSFAVEHLELSADELDAWDELRRRLAHAQGVELDDDSPDRIALHRLLGNPDEVAREFELDCELASAGLDAGDVGAYYEARVDHEDAARAWRLLFQLSADDALDTPEGFDRLLVCVREADLQAGRFDTAWALLR